MQARQIANNFYFIKHNEWKVYFSYETPIAYIHYDGSCYVSENDWGTTTGKHINNVKREYVQYTQIPHEQLLSIINLEIR